MSEIDRRTILAGTTALSAAALMPQGAMAQAPRPSAALPARGEFVIRGAYVLSMDAGIGDLPTGDVHVKDGVIVAVAKDIKTPARAIDGKGMICMPGLIDTHWHHWTNICLLYTSPSPRD